MSKGKIVGFDRTLKLEWIDKAAELAMQGYSPDEINQRLEEFLLDQIKGNQARRKTRTVLLAIWAKTRKELLPFRADAFELLNSVDVDNRIAIHWGMSMAVHPFFGHVAGIIGRLLNLQGTASNTEVQRRVRETYGERQTVSRAVQRLLRTFVFWNVLADTSKQSVYAPCPKIGINESRLIRWLTEAFLYATESSSGALNGILGSPIFFPFSLDKTSSRDLSLSGRLEIVRHGLDEDLVMLRKPNKGGSKDRAPRHVTVDKDT